MDASSPAVIKAEPLVMCELVFPSDLNSQGTMFGGKVIALMDKCAGLCASRWCKRVAVTASIDAIQFTTPIRQGQMVEAGAKVIFVGTTSCLVEVDLYATDLLAGDKFFCCTGYFTMVAIDAHGKPVRLPRLPVETPEQQADWERGAKIKAELLERRASRRNPPPV
jgi:acyl-CoA hydrolase